MAEAHAGPKQTGPLYTLGDATPTVHATAWVAPTACVIGRVVLEENSSVWFNAVIRASVTPPPPTPQGPLCLREWGGDSRLGVDIRCAWPRPSRARMAMGRRCG